MQHAMQRSTVIRLSSVCRRLMQDVISEASLYLMRTTTRRCLRELNERLLADIGLDERDRRRECAKWFWED